MGYLEEQAVVTYTHILQELDAGRLPPCPHFGLLHSTKPTQPPLLLSEFGNPPSPLCADVIY